MGNALKIKMGVDASGVKKGTQEAKGHLNSFQKTAKTVSVAVKTAWAAVGVAVVKVFKDMINLTQKWGDEFNARTAGMRNVYRSLVRDLASGAGWKELGDHIRNAYKAGKELAERIDAEFELDNATQLKVLDIQKEIAALNTIMRITSLSDEERKKAADAIIEKEKAIGQLKLDYAGKVYKDAMDQFRLDTMMTEEEAQQFILEYAHNTELLKQAKQYAELQRQAKAARDAYESGGHGVTKGNKLRAMNEANAAVAAFTDAAGAEELTKIARLANLYNRSNDETVTRLINSWTALKAIEVEVIDLSRKAVITSDKMAQNIENASNKAVGSQVNSGLKFNLGKIDLGLQGNQTQIYEDICNQMQSFADGLEPVPIDIEVKPLVMISGDQIKQMLVGLAEDVLASFGELLGNMINGESAFQNFGQDILKIVGQFAVRFGELLMSIGTATLSLKNVFTNPYAAMAAGAALIALGSAVSTLASNMSSGNYASSSTYAKGYSGSGYSGDYAERAMSVNVTGTLVANGSQLIAVINNENNRKQHTT